MDNIKLLEEILIFLNAVPNRKYGNNYLLASQLEELIKEEKVNLEIGKDLSEIINQDIDNVSDSECVNQILGYLADKNLYIHKQL